MYDEVKMHIQEMLDVGAIQPSNSPWASAVVLVQKKEGKLRFYIDLRKLNARTIKDAHSLPQIKETWDCLDGAEWFHILRSKIWILAGRDGEDRKALTAFTVRHLGFYEYEQMPFG